MSNSSRRQFIRNASAAGLAGVAQGSAFAALIERALAVPAAGATGTIADLEHVVFLMQENRSFDSYFGALAGVRGFSDPRPIPLPTGKPVWYQPGGNAGHVLPYHFDVRNTNAVRIGLDHSWKGSESTWKDWNAWVARKSVRTMGYFDRSDLPFYYALADAFTVCDAYHCSIFGPTDPNRFYALSGHSGGTMTGIPDARLYNVTSGIYNADIANDNAAAKGIEWRSYAEILQANGISWKVYQEWDNYGDNYLQYFKNFRVDANGQRLTPASPLYQRCRATAPGSTAANAKSTTGQWLIDAFAADVRNGTLPAVSWICAPTEYCEHPEATPNAGENFTARLLAALVANPEVWARTALIITYDENDGFFDHMPAVMPPVDANRGRTTLANATQGELYGGEPVGLGPRVPLLMVSPWSKGGRVCSQLFDHTSLLRLLEEWLTRGRGFDRAKVRCDAISPWRRAVCGDLTRTLDFGVADKRFPAGVPASAAYPKNWGTRDALPPANQTMPRQEAISGTTPRPAVPLPYRSSVDGLIPGGTAAQLGLSFANTGTEAAAFIVYSTLRSDGPWHYAVEAGKRIDNEIWNWGASGYHLAVHSHNGFLREFRGGFGAAARAAEVTLAEELSSRMLRLTFFNRGTAPCRFRLADNAYGDRAVLAIDVAPGQAVTQWRAVTASHGWYDLVVTLDGEPTYQRRLAGHMEGASFDYTDPALNGLASVVWSTPPLPGDNGQPGTQPSLRASAAQIRVGESVTLTWQNLPAGTRHWFGVYLKGQTPGVHGSLKWDYVVAPGGAQTLSGLAAGDYFIGLFLNDGYAEAAPRVDLKVV